MTITPNLVWQTSNSSEVVYPQQPFYLTDGTLLLPFNVDTTGFGRHDVNYAYSYDGGNNWNVTTQATTTFLQQYALGQNVETGELFAVGATTGTNRLGVTYVTWDRASGTITFTTSDRVLKTVTGNIKMPSVKVFDIDNVSYIAVAAGEASVGLSMGIWSRTTGGTWSTEVAWNTAMSNTTTLSATVDFHHTGDGRTVKDATPHVYIFGDESGAVDVRISRWGYTTSPSWSETNEAVLGEQGYGEGGFYWDGTRMVFANRVNADPWLMVGERNEANTATNTAIDDALPPHSSTWAGYAESPDIAYDDDQNVHLFSRTTESKITYSMYDRTAATWTDPVDVSTTGVGYPRVTRDPYGYNSNLIYAGANDRSIYHWAFSRNSALPFDGWGQATI